MRFRRTVAVVTSVLILGPTGPSAAQEASAPGSTHVLSIPEVPSGDVVRVTLLGTNEPVIGRYRSRTIEAIELESLTTGSRKPLTIPLDRASRIEVSLKRKAHTWTGVLVGFLVGAGATLAVAQANRNPEAPAILVGLVYIPVGMGFGALVGSGIVSHQWKTIWERSPESTP